MRLRHLLTVGTLCSLLSLASCQKAGEIKALFQEMQAVRAEVAKMTPSEEVGIALMNGNTLNVSVVNPLSDVISERRARALEIARLVYGSYPSRASLNTVNVTIVKRRRHLFLLSMTNNASFTFKAAELMANAAGAA